MCYSSLLKITFQQSVLPYFNILVIKTIKVQQKKLRKSVLRCAKSLKGVPIKSTVNVIYL